jgi:endonuclease/exonuclease/phosphatase (EEP) superfamily protein YafD
MPADFSGNLVAPSGPLAFVRRWAGRLAWVGLAVVAMIYLVAWIVPELRGDQDSWRFIWGVAFFARVVQLHVAFCVGVLAVLLLVVRAGSSGVAGVVLALLLFAPWWGNVIPGMSVKPTGGSFRIFAFNMLVNNVNVDGIDAEIARWDPDVVVLVEANSILKRELFPRLRNRYAFFHDERREGSGDIFSRLPLVPSAQALPDVKKPRWAAEIEFEGRRFALYGIHLLSPSQAVRQAESALVDAAQGDWSAPVRTLKMAFGAAEINREQAGLLHDIVRLETRPTIFAGDFNATYQTQSLQWLRSAGMRSSHALAGTGAGLTWQPVWASRWHWVPGVQIDQILVSPEFAVVSHHVGRRSGSDHSPVIADIGWATEPKGAAPARR